MAEGGSRQRLQRGLAAVQDCADFVKEIQEKGDENFIAQDRAEEEVVELENLRTMAVSLFWFRAFLGP